MRVFETQLPGVGVRYTLRFPTGKELVILTHNEGRREVFWRADREADAERLFDVDESNARRLSDILEGTYFRPVTEDLEDVFEDARIRWIHVDADSALTGHTIGEAALRSRTGVTILGIRRDEEVIADVDPETTIEAGDVLVAVGTERAHESLGELLEPPH